MKRQYGMGEAIGALYPGAQWVIYNNDYSTLVWNSTDQKPPTLEEINQKIIELEAAEPMRVLREMRDFALASTDWTQAVDIRELRGEQWCSEWDAYRKSLRDMTTTNIPKFDENDMITNVVWPKKPSTK